MKLVNNLKQLNQAIFQQRSASSQSGPNRRIVLASRPVGRPRLENFRLEHSEMPEVDDHQILLRTLFLSLDPYMRGRMSDASSYTEPVAVGEVMGGGTVARVEVSRNSNFAEGDLVLSNSGWQDYSVSTGEGVMKLGEDFAQPSLALGVLGMPGFTAYMGLLDIGQPLAGETIVVGAASGAVGSVVGQIGKIKGCRSVGIAGGADKCRFVLESLGFDACIDRHAPDAERQLKAACPNGIDVYFESVGGEVFEWVLPLLNTRARIPLCGLISQYNDTMLPTGQDKLGLFTRTILTKRLRVQGFIIFADYIDRYSEFAEQMGQWVRQGKVKFLEDIVEGIEQAPQAFIGLLEGKNFGKLIVRVNGE